MSLVDKLRKISDEANGITESKKSLIEKRTVGQRLVVEAYDATEIEGWLEIPSNFKVDVSEIKREIVKRYTDLGFSSLKADSYNYVGEYGAGFKNDNLLRYGISVCDKYGSINYSKLVKEIDNCAKKDVSDEEVADLAEYIYETFNDYKKEMKDSSENEKEVRIKQFRDSGEADKYWFTADGKIICLKEKAKVLDNESIKRINEVRDVIIDNRKDVYKFDELPEEIQNEIIDREVGYKFFNNFKVRVNKLSNTGTIKEIVDEATGGDFKVENLYGDRDRYELIDSKTGKEFYIDFSREGNNSNVGIEVRPGYGDKAYKFTSLELTKIYRLFRKKVKEVRSTLYDATRAEIEKEDNEYYENGDKYYGKD